MPKNRGLERREGAAKCQSPRHSSEAQRSCLSCGVTRLRWKVGRPRRPKSEGLGSSMDSADLELHVREKKLPEPERREMLLKRRQGTCRNPYGREEAPISQSTGLVMHEASAESSEGPPRQPVRLFWPHQAFRTGLERIQPIPPTKHHQKAAAGAQRQKYHKAWHPTELPGKHGPQLQENQSTQPDPEAPKTME